MNKRRLSQRLRGIMLVAVGALVASATPTFASVCSLADHIRAANTNRAVGACPAGTSHDVITITEDITLTEPLPVIRGTITIEGGGHTISGGDKFPIFLVEGGSLTINNLTLTEGSDEATAESAFEYGGALQVIRGGEARVNHSTFVKNKSYRHGGAIFVGRGRLWVESSRFLDNEAEGDGGAIALWESAGVINNSGFVGNSTRPVQTGGAIGVSTKVTLDVFNSTFSGNKAGRGGAIATDIWTPRGYQPSRTTLTHVTMVDNRSTENRGHNIWVDEQDANFKLRNSLVLSDATKRGVSCQGPLNENSGNFISDGSCASMAGGDARLAEMAGWLAHFPLLDGSPALDAADPRYCPQRDQIGTPRPQGGGCDIGAIESTTAIPAPTAIPAICPLPDQIIAANTDSPVGNCPAGNGADAIFMIRDFTLSAKLPPITSDITLEGNGYTISGDDNFGIFEVDGGSLTISDVTLTAGRASKGGAILLKNGGRASVTQVAFLENTAFFGGAIATEGEADRLTVRDSSFIGNRAETTGGAIVTDGGNVDVSASAFLDNRAGDTGGAIATLSGRAAIANSTVSGGAALQGGGIYVNGGETTLTHLTLLNNRAERVYGAGIYREAGAVHLRNSIVAGSGGGDDCSGRLAQNRGNFSEDGTCAAQAGGDPLLGELVEAPRIHYPLLDASPAHGAADRAFCLAADQLGNPRPHCDIGAIESARDPNFVAEPRPLLPADCTLADQIIAANSDAPAGSCPAGAGADVIRLRRDIRLNAPLPPINSDIALDGGGHTISGGGRLPILDIESGVVVLKHITLVDGVNLGAHPEGYGGAVTLRNKAELLIVNATFRDNRARMGGAVASIDRSGLLVLDSGFYDNEALGKGGAIWRDGDCGSINNIDFVRNKAGERAGTPNDDYFTQIDGISAACVEGPEVYSLAGG